MVRSLSSWVSSWLSPLSGRPRPWQTRLHTIQSQPKPTAPTSTAMNQDSAITPTTLTTATEAVSSSSASSRWHAANPGYMLAWQRANRDKVREYNRKWRAANKVKAQEATRKWAAANPEIKQKNYAAWAARNPAKVRAKSAKRAAIKKQNCCSCCAPVSFKLLYRQAKALGMHVDHIKPLARGGLHCLKNMQLLPPSDNRRKGATC
jgi:5-methylcytosine-specific restriction endonuclease McrA